MNDPQLLALHNIDERLTRLLLIEATVYTKRPHRMSNAFAIVRTALHICANAHDRGGCTSGQLQELEACIAKMEQSAS